MLGLNVDSSVNSVIDSLRDKYDEVIEKDSKTTSSRYVFIKQKGYKELKVRISDHVSPWFQNDIYVQPIAKLPFLFYIHKGVGSSISVGSKKAIKKIIDCSLVKEKEKTPEKSERQQLLVEIDYEWLFRDIEKCYDVPFPKIINVSKIPSLYQMILFRKKDWSSFYAWYKSKIYNIESVNDPNTIKIFKDIFTCYNYKIEDIQKILYRNVKEFGLCEGIKGTARVLDNYKKLVYGITNENIEQFFALTFCKDVVKNEAIKVPDSFKDYDSDDFKWNEFVAWYDMHGINLQYEMRSEQFANKLKKIVKHYRYIEKFHDALFEMLNKKRYVDKAINDLYEITQKEKIDIKVDNVHENNVEFFSGVIEEIDSKWNSIKYRKDNFDDWEKQMSKMFKWVDYMTDGQRRLFKRVSIKKVDNENWIRVAEYLLAAYNKNKNASIDAILHTALILMNSAPQLRWDFIENKEYLKQMKNS